VHRLRAAVGLNKYDRNTFYGPFLVRKIGIRIILGLERLVGEKGRGRTVNATEPRWGLMFPGNKHCGRAEGVRYSSYMTALTYIYMLMNNFPLSLGAGSGKYFQHWPGYHSDVISRMF
jgi:hypothetical protein